MCHEKFWQRNEKKMFNIISNGEMKITGGVTLDGSDENENVFIHCNGEFMSLLNMK